MQSSSKWVRPMIHQFTYHWFRGKNLSKNMEVRSPVSGFIPYAKALLRRPNISGIITTFRESSEGTQHKNDKFGAQKTAPVRLSWYLLLTLLLASWQNRVLRGKLMQIVFSSKN